MKEAMLYIPLDGGEVQCQLCHHRCKIPPGETGICEVRRNEDGRLYSLVYGKAIACNVDPIEKKPLFHFLPGSRCVSVATAGCNFRCEFCQNYSISQMVRDHGRIPGDPLPPEQIVDLALRQGCRSISFTYTEPTIFFEYAYETAQLAHERGLKNNFVSNAYMTPEALETIRPYLDGINADLKSFRETTYKKHMGARLEKVLETLREIKRLGIWLEVTTLVIPGLNDSLEELQDIAEFIASLGPETPWHVSRFHPDYTMLDRSATPVERIHDALRIGRAAGLRYLYAGNVFGDESEGTFCPACNALVISRMGFHVGDNRLKDGYCPQCGETIEGVWE